MQYKLFEVNECKSSGKNTFTAVITTSSMDRDGEVLLSQGADYTEFMKNPTVFYNHDYAQPIAKALKLWKTNNSIKAEVKMAERPSGYQGDFFPEYVMALIDQGIIKGISIGFETLDARLPSKKDISEFGKEVKRVITRYKLIEFSVAPLQCNVDAQVVAVAKGFKNKEFNRKIFNLEIEPEVKVESKDWEFEVIPAEKKSASVQDIEIEVLRRKGFIYFD